MFGSPILDVAIGMAFVYLLLSFIASAVQEALAALTQARAANLQRGLNSLFSGDTLDGGKKLVELLIEHGLVRGLYQDPDRDFKNCEAGSQLATKTRLTRFSSFRLWARRALRINPPGVPDDPKFLFFPAYIPSRTFALAMRDLLTGPAGDGSVKAMAARLQGLRDLEGAKDNKALQALSALVRDAGDKTDRLQQNFENWYNDGMDRVSGWYKKYAQNVLLIIGLVLAIVFNVNSVRLGRVLWADRNVREGLVAATNQYMEEHKRSNNAVPMNTDTDKEDLTGKLNRTVAAFDQVSDSLMLPIGWHHSPAAFFSQLFSSDFFTALWRLFVALVGWGITALALSLGASFWFDTLNKFMVVRSTIKPQEKSQIEASKDAHPSAAAG